MAKLAPAMLNSFGRSDIYIASINVSRQALPLILSVRIAAPERVTADNKTDRSKKKIPWV
jgi:hypothetical protein